MGSGGNDEQIGGESNNAVVDFCLFLSISFTSSYKFYRCINSFGHLIRDKNLREGSVWNYFTQIIKKLKIMFCCLVLNYY